ncbi:hypothetical protein [Desulfovibrio sp. Huiquan2017]|uniref:hypothetical protein n=1 Tax=Desulfovibrio sp. Huiquan2017 TaxID=2816861 RepID=UPI001A922284|nr:hypothetical protein [Desulfovibrio sp. Huiquan2017]
MTDNSKQQPPNSIRVLLSLLVGDKQMEIRNVSGFIPGLTPNGGQFHSATVCRDRRGDLYLRHPHYYVDDYGETDTIYDVRLTNKMLLLLLYGCTSLDNAPADNFFYYPDGLPEISDEEFTRILNDAAAEVCKINMINNS